MEKRPMKKRSRLPEGTPTIPREVIDWLKRKFPDRCPNLGELSEGRVPVMIGQQEVIRMMERTFEAQNPDHYPKKNKPRQWA